MNGEDLRGELILICDIGGGHHRLGLGRALGSTASCSLQRTAIGEHLLLGGDNLDFALARRVEDKVAEDKLKDIPLTLRQRYALRRGWCREGAAARRFVLGFVLRTIARASHGSWAARACWTVDWDSVRPDARGSPKNWAAGFLPSHRRQFETTHGRAHSRATALRRNRACLTLAIPPSPVLLLHLRRKRRRHERFVGKPTDGLTQRRALQRRLLRTSGDSR